MCFSLHLFPSFPQSLIVAFFLFFCIGLYPLLSGFASPLFSIFVCLSFAQTKPQSKIGSFLFLRTPLVGSAKPCRAKKRERGARRAKQRVQTNAKKTPLVGRRSLPLPSPFVLHLCPPIKDWGGERAGEGRKTGGPLHRRWREG